MSLPSVGIIAIAVLVCIGIAFTVRAFLAREGPDHATTKLLKRFFDGKECAICKQPIPPVGRMGMRPGLLNPVTHEFHLWDEIPKINLSTALESQVPVCSACGVAESFRQRFPDRVVDSDRSGQDTPSPDRIGAGS